MIDRIVESFTKPQLEITAIDSLIQGVIISIAVILIVLIVSFVSVVKDEIKDKKIRRKNNE